MVIAHHSGTVVAARRAFFEEGETLPGAVDYGIYRSWLRCRDTKRSEHEPIEYEHIGMPALKRLKDRNVDLLRVAAEPIDNLGRAVGGAGYAVLLTDANGYVLKTSGAIDRASRAMSGVFKEGANLTEDAIGTSAMSCAMAERRAMRVFGQEHYYATNSVFHCSAAPIFGTIGQVIGSVDISCLSGVPDFGALAIVGQCVQSIEQALIKTMPSFLTLHVFWQLPRKDFDQRYMTFSFADDGRVIAITETARQFLGPSFSSREIHFNDIFDVNFAECAAWFRRANGPVPIRLRSGLSLFAVRENGLDCAIDQTIVALSVPTEQMDAPMPPAPSCREPATGMDEQYEFGDAGIDTQIDIAASTLAGKLPLIISGETGTGKDVVAKLLHDRVLGKAAPFIAINCAAIPDGLIEGELFGHVEGAYTGAKRGGSPGKIELADGGTLFLDEIGDMPFHLQSRLLRVLETQTVSRLGTSVSRRVNFRLICATHQNLPLSVREGRFRQDLYYRISGFLLNLPPLRVRTNLSALIESILNRISANTRTLAPQTMMLLCNHDWPGNTREVKHVLTYAHTVAESHCAIIGPEHLPSTFGAELGLPPATGNADSPRLLKAMEGKAIAEAIRQSGNNVPAAAAILGISRATLYRRLQKLKNKSVAP